MSRYRDTRYRVYPDIGTNVGIYRYRDQMSRCRVIEFPDIAHDVSCSQQAPGPGLGLAFQLLQPARNRWGKLYPVQLTSLFFFRRSCGAGGAQAAGAGGSSGSAPSCGGGVDGCGELVNAWLCTMSSSANLSWCSCDR